MFQPASKDQVQPLLEKARGELPAKAPPPKKKTAEAPKPVSRPVSAVEDDEEENTKPAAPSKAETKNEKPDLKSKALGKAKGKVQTSQLGKSLLFSPPAMSVGFTTFG